MARSLTGVCPQFEILWGDLTAAEHMVMYADIKGIPWAERTTQAEILLQKVGSRTGPLDCMKRCSL